MAKVLYIDRFRSRRTKIHPHSLAALNQYAKVHPWDEDKHHAAWKIVNEFPNKPMSLKDISNRLDDDLTKRILKRADELKW